METLDIHNLAARLKEAEEQRAYFKAIAAETSKIHLQETEQLSRIIQSYKRMVADLQAQIADRKSAEAATHESHELLLTVLNSIDAAIYVADMQTHRILFANSYMISSFGREVTGEKCHDVFRELDIPCEHCTNKRLLDAHGKPTGLIVWQGQNPVTNKWYINYDRAIKWPDGRFVRIQISTDIREIKQMEAERRRNEDALRKARHLEAIGTLAGGIAHDLNNLLQIIFGNLSLAEDEGLSAKKRTHYLKGIKYASYKAKELASQLITFSTGGTPNRIAMPIVPLLEELCKELIHGSAVTYEVCCPADAWLTAIDSTQLSIALKNVIINALESMSNRGTLDIRVENILKAADGGQGIHPVPKGRYVKIRIHDTGHGIAEEILPKIYEPYFSTKSRGPQKGMGMGLAIVYSIVKRHSGHIFVQSRLTVGTTVDIYLPAEDGAPAERRRQTVSPPRPRLTNTRRILLMDDEEMIQLMAMDLFAFLGYPVDVASDGREAIARYSAMLDAGKRYLLVILDLTVVGGMGGVPAVNRLLQMDQAVRAIVSSGYSDDPVVTDFRKYGFTGVLAKPYTIDELKKLLTRIQSEL
jgi:signal transduction histidine kinase/ActR/RegA family two-component response regulator